MTDANPPVSNEWWPLVLPVLLALFVVYCTSLCCCIYCGDADLSVRGCCGSTVPIDLKFWKGKVVWITGASSGIGEAYARIVAEHGAKAVVVSARRVDKLQVLADSNSSIKALKLDVTDHQAVADAIKQIVDDYGTIDVAVLNAGRGASCLADEFDVQMSAEMLELNVLSYINATKLLIPVMRANPHKGNLVVTSSVAGKMPSPGASTYCATKHALQGYFNACRVEVSEFMHVTLVCPGPVATEFGQARFAGPDEQALGQKKYSTYMTAERCGHLMCVATQRRLEEVWLSPQPILLYTYLACYFPGIFAHLIKGQAKKLVPKSTSKTLQQT